MVPVPSIVLPSRKVTVPVADDGEIVAVSVTELPYVDGFNDELSCREVFASLTTCVRVDEVPPLSFTSPA